MSKLEFVDAYFHLMDPLDPRFRYPIMEPGQTHPHLGEHIDRLRGNRYLIEDYLRDSSSSNLIAAIHTDADAGGDPVDESQYLQEQADRTGFPTKFLGLVDLTNPNIDNSIKRHMQFRNFRGVRHRSPGPYFDEPSFQSGYALLEKYHLTCDIGVRPANSMGKVREQALRFPSVPMALNHCGMVLTHADSRDRSFLDEWKAGLQIAAQAENVMCKIEGITVFDHDWTVDSFRPWVMTVIEAFGTDRCMFGSHWPYDVLFGSYESIIDAYAEIISDFTPDEQQNLFSRNAMRMYDIKVASATD